MPSHAVHRVCMCPARDLLAVAVQGEVLLFKHSTGEQVSPKLGSEPLKFERPVYALQFTPDGNTLVVGFLKTVILVDCDTHARQTVELRKHISSVAIAHDNSVLVVADKFGDVFVVALPVSGRVKIKPNTEPALGHYSIVLDMKFDPSGKFLVTCDRDENVRVNKYPALADIQEMCHGHTSFVSGCVFVRPTHDRNASRLLTGGGDGVLRLWDFEAGREVAKLTVDGVKPAENDRDASNCAVVPICTLAPEDPSTAVVLVDFDEAPSKILLVSTEHPSGLVVKRTVESPDGSMCFDVAYVQRQLVVGTSSDKTPLFLVPLDNTSAEQPASLLTEAYERINVTVLAAGETTAEEAQKGAMKVSHLSIGRQSSHVR